MYYAKLSLKADINFVNYVQFEDQYIITPVTESLRKLAENYILDSYSNRCKILDSKIIEGVKVNDSYVIEVNYLYHRNDGRLVNRGMHVYGNIEFITEDEYVEQALLGGM